MFRCRGDDIFNLGLGLGDLDTDADLDELSQDLNEAKLGCLEFTRWRKLAQALTQALAQVVAAIIVRVKDFLDKPYGRCKKNPHCQFSRELLFAAGMVAQHPGRRKWA